MNLIDVVADAQASPVKSTARDGPDTHRSSQGKQTLKDGADTQRTLNPKYAGKEKEGVEALSPIREMASEEDAAQDKKLSQYSQSVLRDSTKESSDNEMQVSLCLWPTGWCFSLQVFRITENRSLCLAS